MTTIPGATVTHDARGNITFDGVKTFAYDADNRLITATQSGQATVSQTYDPAGRLYQSAGTATTRFLYDGVNVIGEYDGSNALLRRYAHGPGSDEPLVWLEGSGTADRRVLMADVRGSIIAVTNSAGTVTSKNTYDTYGTPAINNIGRFQYTGQMWMAELKLYHFKARAYHPSLGRFLQTDPTGYGDGLNLYQYAGSDPINARDPSGLFEDQIYVQGARTGCSPGASCLSGDELDNFLRHNQQFFIDEIVVVVSRSNVNIRGTDFSNFILLPFRFGHENLAQLLVCKDGSDITEEQLADAFSAVIVPRYDPQPVDMTQRTTSLVTDPRGLIHTCRGIGFENPGGYVRTSFDGPFSGTNQTTRAHFLYNGSVARTVSRTPGGAIAVTTFGTGSNFGLLFAYVNATQGPGIFKELDRKFARRLLELSEQCGFDWEDLK